ncbi:hypothetical protein [Maribacter sp. ACAM166]|uniref:hypothetical protein n=1 Tax=Maribacter sp. ACAM166 TaxID=2508996 RepID=UPI0010FED391|nr:hypothetical protein [Maribacter sp. ACAM166]TLP82329.1 hypothetical protein ES765_02530 [Maribacter sp. ACAM166]
MKLDVVNSDQLLQIAEEKLLVKKMLQQIEKDFSLANVSLTMPVNLEPQSIISTIREKIYYLMMEHFSGYLNLLYIVDVPEREFQYIESTDTVEVANQVTFLLLKREYQKVWFKEKYK